MSDTGKVSAGTPSLGHSIPLVSPTSNTGPGWGTTSDSGPAC